MKLKKTAALLATALILLLQTGCWSYHELETYSIVAGIALDKGQNGYKYHVTLECIDMSSTGGPTAGIEPQMLEEDGNSVFDAMRSTLRESDKKLYFNHCKIVVVSSDLAKEGIKPLLDWFQRDAEPRVTLAFLISKEKTAGEILRVAPQTGQITAFQISNSLNESESYYGGTPNVQLYQINNILNAEGVSVVLPAIETKTVASGKTVQLTGAAVFKGDKQVGWLDDEPAKYFVMARGEANGGLLLTGEKPGAADIVLEILSLQSKIEPVISGDSVSMRVGVEMVVAFAEQNGTVDYLTKDGTDKIEGYAERTIRDGVQEVVESVQQRFDSDIFGFGNSIFLSDPGEWERLKPRWDDTFRGLKVEVDAKVVIRDAALGVVKGGK